MSAENIEIVRKRGDGFNAFMRGELSDESFAELHDPRIEVNWDDQQTYPGASENVRGLAKFMEFKEHQRSTVPDVSQEQLALIEAPDDRVFAVIRQSGHAGELGVPTVDEFFEVLTIRARKVRKIEFFRHGIDALKAAGLSDQATAALDEKQRFAWKAALPA